MGITSDWGTAGVVRSNNVATTSITGAAYTSYASGSDTNSYIPILFAKKMLRIFYAQTAYEMISNTDYDGQISKMGDQIVINRAPDMNITDYQVGQVIDYQVPTSSEVTLNIDQAK